VLYPFSQVGLPLHAGRIDVLINNAAVTRFGPLLEQPLSEVREVLDADVIGLLAMSQVAGAHSQHGYSLPFGASWLQSCADALAGCYCNAGIPHRLILASFIN
jgi:NAD(P)-dependent dehydrogenase (short-subunit alcohol dehydrogenase family)